MRLGFRISNPNWPLVRNLFKSEAQMFEAFWLISRNHVKGCKWRPIQSRHFRFPKLSINNIVFAQTLVAAATISLTQTAHQNTAHPPAHSSAHSDTTWPDRVGLCYVRLVHETTEYQPTCTPVDGDRYRLLYGMVGTLEKFVRTKFSFEML